LSIVVNGQLDESGAVEAVLWDVPALLQLVDGQALIRAFGPLSRESEPTEASRASALSVAAHVVTAFRTGEPRESLEIGLAQLAGLGSPEELLALSLQAWIGGSSEGVPNILRRLEVITQTVTPDHARARLLRRLSLHAAERGVDDLATRAVRDALDLVDHGSPLESSLRSMGQAQGLEVPFPAGSPADDDLISQPWIRSMGFAALAERERNAFEDALKSVWSFTWRGGQQPVHLLDAAQTQADWSGAFGLRDELRRLMAMPFLASGTPARPSDQVWAAEVWAAARGKHPGRVLRGVERHLDGAAATGLLKRLTGPTNALAPIEIAGGLWDLVDDEGVSYLLERVDPGLPDDVRFDDARMIWGNLLWRAPAVFVEHWKKLTRDRQRSALSGLAVGTVEVLTHEQLVALRDGVATDGAAAAFGVAVVRAVDPDRPPETEIASSRELLELLAWDPASVAPSEADRHVQLITEAVENSREEALQGTIGMGGTDARELLGALAAATGRKAEEVAGLLADLATDDRMPSQHQLGAIRGLRRLKLEGRLDASLAARVARWDGSSRPSLDPPLDQEGERAARLALAAGTLTEAELFDLAASCRSPNVRTRLTALTAVLDDAKAGERNPLVTAVLYGALYDPDDEVASAALRGVAASTQTLADGDELAARAVKAAFDRGTTHMRVLATYAARRVGGTHGASVVAEAAIDPSWQVREAAESRLGQAN
jgi:hypothetical protein